MPKGKVSKFKTLKEAFLSYKTKSNSLTGCIEWANRPNNTGYGIVCFMKVNYLAHRLAYEFHHGELPDNLLVCHHCDNRICVNIEHLFVGTHKDNNLDAAKKGRVHKPSGELNYNTHLSNADVKLIRMLVSVGAEQQYVAEWFGIHQTTVSKIHLSKSWKHI